VSDEDTTTAEAQQALSERIGGGYVKTLGRSAEYIAEHVIEALWQDNFEVVHHVHQTFEVEKKGSPVRTFLCRHPLCGYASTEPYELDDRRRIELLEAVYRAARAYRDTDTPGRAAALDEALANLADGS
jgi:hypothetical protein